MMQDRLFRALYRSNDPKVRAAAMDKLNKAHHQAYGDAPTKDDDAGTGRKSRRPSQISLLSYSSQSPVSPALCTFDH